MKKNTRIIMFYIISIFLFILTVFLILRLVNIKSELDLSKEVILKKEKIILQLNDDIKELELKKEMIESQKQELQYEQLQLQLKANQEYVGNFNTGLEFYENMKNNPIDKKYNDELNNYKNDSKVNINIISELEQNYFSIWEEEMEYTYEQLMFQLARIDKDEHMPWGLEESQNLFLQYIDEDFHFYYYDIISNSNIGEYKTYFLRRFIKEKVRERTIELKEYLYILSGEVDFLYSYN